MEDQLITFETAVLAKTKKFDIPVRYGVMGQKMKLTENHGWENHKALELRNWNTNKANSYSIPTQSLLQKWLREIHSIIVSVDIGDDRTYFISLTAIYPNSTGDNIWGNYKTYEEALENGLKEALKLIN